MQAEYVVDMQAAEVQHRQHAVDLAAVVHAADSQATQVVAVDMAAADTGKL
jgi:hypothetical protein